MIDYCKDKANCAIIIGELVKSQGWLIVKEEMDKRINSAAYKLQNADPTDSIYINKLQNTIKNYKSLQEFVEDFLTK